MKRRDFLKVAAVGGAVFGSRLAGAGARGAGADFYFVQLSDTHWGFSGPPNPRADVTLPRAIEAVNALEHPPDFVVFTGDLIHTTDDDALRRKRLGEVKRMAAALKVKDVRFLPGEHDASLDAGAAFREVFGPTHWSFDRGGVHFVALDNVSDPKGAVGASQLEWLRADLERRDADAPLVVLTHRPLFDLYPQWDWATADGAKALALLEPHRHTTVFYGHIHQEHHHVTGAISHHAARSLMFPLPAPGSVPKKAPLPWDESRPWRGLGFREVEEPAEHVDERTL